jgi:hypothetical protein
MSILAMCIASNNSTQPQKVPKNINKMENLKPTYQGEINIA